MNPARITYYAGTAALIAALWFALALELLALSLRILGGGQ